MCVCVCVCVLQCTGKRLPEWAFQQYEVVTEKDVSSTAAVWLLDDVILPSPSNATAWAEEERCEHVATVLYIHRPSLLLYLSLFLSSLRLSTHSHTHTHTHSNP